MAFCGIFFERGQPCKVSIWWHFLKFSKIFCSTGKGKPISFHFIFLSCILSWMVYILEIHLSSNFLEIGPKNPIEPFTLNWQEFENFWLKQEGKCPAGIILYLTLEKIASSYNWCCLIWLIVIDSLTFQVLFFTLEKRTSRKQSTNLMWSSNHKTRF